MSREFPLWLLVLLPIVAALPGALGARPLLGWLGLRRSFSLAHYLGLGATVLSLIFLVQGVALLNFAEDPRALGQTLLEGRLPPLELGELVSRPVLVGDRLSIAAALVIAGGFALARLFAGGPVGSGELGVPHEGEPEPRGALRSLRRLALLGLLEGAAMLVVLAADLVLVAIGWALIGIGSALAVTREFDDERRASAATRVLALAFVADFGLLLALVMAVVGGIGATHTDLWSPLLGAKLFATAPGGVPLADAIALGLIVAVVARVGSLVQLGNSIAEALLEAVVVAVPSVYLLLRYLRVLSLSPSLLAALAILGLLAIVLGVAVALIRPGRGQARRRQRSGDEQALAGTAMASFGSIALALSVGAWRTAVLVLLAHALGRLGLRLALLGATPGSARLPPVTGHVTRVLALCVAGLVPTLGFVVLGRLVMDLIARTSMLPQWFGWLAALVVLGLAFGQAAAIARLWYLRDAAGQASSQPEADDEDGLDFASAGLAALALIGLGVLALTELLGRTSGPTSWLAKLLPEGGGHPSVPMQIRASYLAEGGTIAIGWLGGALALVALLGGFGWLWARERFRRGDGRELVRHAHALERGLAIPRRLLGWLGLVFVGLAELAARGIGRGLFEEGPRVVASLGRDLGADLTPRMRRSGLASAGARLGLLGLVGGIVFVLGWLFFKPSVIDPLPTEPHDFGGLRPQLIRAGGKERAPAASDAEASESRPAIEPEALPEVPR